MTRDSSRTIIAVASGALPLLGFAGVLLLWAAAFPQLLKCQIDAGTNLLTQAFGSYACASLGAYPLYFGLSLGLVIAALRTHQSARAVFFRALLPITSAMPWIAVYLVFLELTRDEILLIHLVG